MKKYKGFSLAECVIAVAIVMLISFAIANTCLIAVSNSNKANAIQIINNETLNLVKIVKSTEIEESGYFKPNKLEKALLDYCGKNFNLESSNLNETQSIFFNDNGVLNASGNIELKVTFQKKNEFFALYVCGYYSEKEIKNESVVFEKRVEDWRF